MKKILLTILFLLACSTAHATTWYACSGGGNWNGASVWTSILADEVGCTASTGNPVAGDTAILNSSSGSITLTAAAAAASLTMTGYTGTLAFGAYALTVTGGTVTLATGNTITASTGGITITGTETLTYGGQTFPGVLWLDASTVVTLNNGGATSLNSGLCKFSFSPQLQLTTTGDTLTCSSGLNMINNAGTGTATIILTGGTWSGGANVGNPLILNGNVTVSSAVYLGTGTSLTYSSGTITTTGSILTCSGSCTLNTPGIIWPTFTNTSTSTTTLGAPLTVVNFIFNSNSSETFSGAYDIYATNATLKLTSGNINETLVAGQTFHITNSLTFAGDVSNSYSIVFKSSTASSPAYINYTGTTANAVSVGMKFTDIYFSGSPLPLYNYGGVSGSLTRTSGITNVTPQIYKHTPTYGYTP
jgi:hypothetical protein